MGEQEYSKTEFQNHGVKPNL